MEVRVIGCLLEKQRTTPDAYPLSLNALRLACNQSTARDPVVRYEEQEIRDALHRLGRRRWTRLASGAGSRASKYRHLLDETLGLSREEQAVLAVLALRGPQTSGELRSRTERLFHFGSAEEVEARARAARRARPGRAAAAPAGAEGGALHAPAQRPARGRARGGGARARPGADRRRAPPPPADDRVDRLEREVETLKAQVAELRAELGME